MPCLFQKAISATPTTVLGTATHTKNTSARRPPPARARARAYPSQTETPTTSVAPALRRIRLLAMAPPEPRRTAADDGTPKRLAQQDRPLAAPTARTITPTKSATCARQSSNTTERDGRLRRVVVRRSPASVAAMAATPTQTIRSGIVSAIARVTSYSAANAVNTSVVTRARAAGQAPRTLKRQERR